MIEVSNSMNVKIRRNCSEKAILNEMPIRATLLGLVAAILISGCNQMTTDPQTGRAIEAYFLGLETSDASLIPLHADVVFRGPMVPDGIRGESDVKAFLQDIAAGLETITAERIFVDGEHSCAPFAFTIKDGPSISGVDCFRVLDGLIVEIQPYFDPRPLLAE